MKIYNPNEEALVALQWRHNERNGVSNRRRAECVLNRLLRCRSKKTAKIRDTGLCEGNPPVPLGSPHKGPVPRIMFPFDDVIMCLVKLLPNQDAQVKMISNWYIALSIFHGYNFPCLRYRYPTNREVYFMRSKFDLTCPLHNIVLHSRVHL